MKFGKNKVFWDVKFQSDVMMECYRLFINVIRKRGSALSRSTTAFNDQTGQSTIENANDMYLRRAFDSSYFKCLVFSHPSADFMAFNYDKSALYVSIEDMKDLNLADEIIAYLNKHYETSKLPEMMFRRM